MVAYTPPNGATDVNNVPVHLKALWDTVVAHVTEREATRAPVSHTHPIGQVSGLQAALDARVEIPIFDATINREHAKLMMLGKTWIFNVTGGTRYMEFSANASAGGEVTLKGRGIALAAGYTYRCQVAAQASPGEMAHWAAGDPMLGTTIGHSNAAGGTWTAVRQCHTDELVGLVRPAVNPVAWLPATAGCAITIIGFA